MSELPILVDTSVWIAHLRGHENRLVGELEQENVLCHPFVIGELACGTLVNRQGILALLEALPRSPTISNNEALHFVDRNELYSKGIGLIDIHLLASATLAPARLWTRDRCLNRVAKALGLST